MPDHPRRVGLVVFVLLMGAFYMATAERRFSFDSDAAHYAGLAQSLSRGEGYTFNGRFDTKYPPGYPALLAPVSAISGGRYSALAMVSPFMAAVALALTFVFIQRRGLALALLVVGLFSFSGAAYGVVKLGVTTTPPFLAATMGFLVWAEARGSGETAPGVRATLLGAALLSLTVLLRSVGVALVCGYALTLLHHALARRERPHALDVAVLAAGATTFVAWVLIQSTHREILYPGQYYDSYVHQLLVADPHRVSSGLLTPSGALERVWAMASLRLAGAAAILTNVSWVKPRWFSPAVIGALLVLALGLARELKRPNPLAGWYFVSYMAVLVVWPFSEIRFLVDVATLLFLFALVGGGILVREWMGRPRLSGTVAVAAGAVFAFAGTLTWIVAPADWSRQDTMATLAWLLLAVIGGAWAGGLRPSPTRVARAGRVAAVALVAAYLAIGSVYIARAAVTSVRGVRPTWAAQRARAASWLKTHTRPDAVIMTTWDAALHYGTGRATVPLPHTDSREVLQAAFERLRPHFVVVFDSADADEYFRPGDQVRFALLAEQLPRRFVLAHAFDGGWVYAVLPR